MTRRIPGLTPRARLSNNWRAARRQPADGHGPRWALAFLLCLASTPAFADAWDDVLLGVSFDGKPLRDALNAVAGPEACVILDRRVDPGIPVTVDVQGATRLAAVIATADAAGVSLQVEPIPAISTLCFVGPDASGLGRQVRKLGPRAKVAVAWEDLATPAEVLAAVADDVGIRLRGTDAVPHDLIAGGEFAGVEVTTALAIVLRQYGLTAEPAGRDNEYRIVRSGPGVGPDRGTSAPRAGPGTVEPRRVVPLSERRFRLKARDARVSAVMVKLEASGVGFDYDEDAFAAAGIDLATRVDLDVRDADAGEFFLQLFGPLGIDAEYDGVVVFLKIKK